MKLKPFIIGVLPLLGLLGTGPVVIANPDDLKPPVVQGRDNQRTVREAILDRIDYIESKVERLVPPDGQWSHSEVSDFERDFKQPLLQSLDELRESIEHAPVNHLKRRGLIRDLTTMKSDVDADSEHMSSYRKSMILLNTAETAKIHAEAMTNPLHEDNANSGSEGSDYAIPPSQYKKATTDKLNDIEEKIDALKPPIGATEADVEKMKQDQTTLKDDIEDLKGYVSKGKGLTLAKADILVHLDGIVDDLDSDHYTAEDKIRLCGKKIESTKLRMHNALAQQRAGGDASSDGIYSEIGQAPQSDSGRGSPADDGSPRVHPDDTVSVDSEHDSGHYSPLDQPRAPINDEE